MERKIGEIFEFGGEWYQCIKDTEDISCINCCFYNGGHKLCMDEDMGACAKEYRSDAKSICFKKLEKVGEPYEHYGKLYQCYKLPMEIEIRLLPNNCNPIGKDNLVEIEIKQNKEDMEEKIQHYDCFFDKKKSNLKPFNLEAAKQGKPVCTRDGRKARIICFDRHDNTPIVSLIECVNGAEILQCCHNDGKCFHYETSNNDLMMLPEKKEGWVNVYKNSIYKTKEEAFNRRDKENYLMTIKVGWEE